ncbi:MAG: hypothetical protein V4574_12420 [Pseudomonadota bacterium]
MSLRIALGLGLLAAPLLAATPALAQAQSDEEAAKQIINDPNPATFNVYGIDPKPKSVKDATVQGGRALPLAVTGSGTPYAVGVGSPLTREVKKGDHLTLMFFARLQKAEPGVTSARIVGQIQLSSAPYTSLFAQTFDVPTEWKLFQVSGVADKDYPKGTLNAAFHVNTGRHTMALGLVAVLDKGQ